VNPVEKLSSWAHDRGAIMVCDAAQGAPHRVVDVQALGADFVAITAHKLCGPSGVGALWGRLELLQEMEPFNLGGHMISRVRLEDTSWGEVPAKFEAGTQAIAEAVGFGAAVDYISEIGLDAIEQHEHELAAYGLERLAELPWVKTYGPPADRRAGIISFNVENIHPHDVAQILDGEGVAIRARQRHALMLVEQPPRALIGKIAGGKTGDLHGLLDYLFRRWRKAQFKPFGFVFPLSRYRFLTGGRHNCSPRLHVRQYTVLYKSDGIRACSTICRHGPSAQSIEPTQSN